MTGTLSLSKFMDLRADAPVLELQASIAASLRACDGQTDLRWWEYAMAQAAITAWYRSHADEAGDVPANLTILDVGGAGSRFPYVLQTYTSNLVGVCDPGLLGTAPVGFVWLPSTLEEVAAVAVSNSFDILTCISVIEHLPHMRPFLRAAVSLLKPGGLLFLTTDAWDCDGPDQAHFHWMRERIFNKGTIKRLIEDLRELGMESFGKSDWVYPGDQVYGSYTFASLAMTKKESK